MYLTGLFIYFALLVVIGIVVSRKNPDFDAYFYGERKMGSFLIFFTVTASWFGAASVIATANAAYKTGVNALWLLCIPTLTTIIIFVIINKKVRETRFVSLPVLLEKYYGKVVSGFASFLIFFYMVVLAASQLVAWGTFAGNFLGTGYGITVIIGAAIVIFYSYLGGYLSIVFTDALQFLIITVSLVYLAVFFKNSPSAFKPADFNFFADSEHNLLMTVSFTLAWVISPIIWQKIASARSAKASRWGLLMSVAALAFFYYLVIRAGVYSRNFPATENSADVLGVVIKNWLPVGGGVLVFLGIAAAIMSTAATAMNVGALTLVKDVIYIKHKNRTVLYARIATFICGALAALVALRFDSIIKTLGLASEIMAEGLFIPGMYMLFFKKKRPLAALLSLLLGGGFSIVVFINAYGLSLPLPQWPDSLPYGLGLSLLGFGIGYIFDRK
ncbi:MAG: sodium:solute symporter family protein [Candidatus Aminicenantes bacterium]|nr:sodium:solute symporter family protein [Candidatus Aminicenantes bacterium]